jgi:hypothetical protein
MEDVGIYVLCPLGQLPGRFGIFYGHLVCCTKKNLATLVPMIFCFSGVDILRYRYLPENPFIKTSLWV